MQTTARTDVPANPDSIAGVGCWVLVDAVAARQAMVSRPGGRLCCWRWYARKKWQGKVERTVKPEQEGSAGGRREG